MIGVALSFGSILLGGPYGDVPIPPSSFISLMLMYIFGLHMAKVGVGGRKHMHILCITIYLVFVFAPLMGKVLLHKLN